MNTKNASATHETLNITAPPASHLIEITREFDATPEQLVRAHTDPELYARWIGPHGYTTEVTEFEPRHGGRWAFTQRDAQGSEFSFRGVFHGDPSVEGIRQTFEFLGMPGEVLYETMTFERLENGRTLLRGTSIASSVEARDGMVESGMEHGVREGYAKLDELIRGQ